MKDNNLTDPFYLQIQKEISRIELKSDRYTFLFYLMRLTQIIITGAITIISGFEIDNIDRSITILILGAAVTGVISIDTLFQIETKKNTYKLVLFDLRAIRADLVFNKMEDDLNEKEYSNKYFFEKYKRTLAYGRDLIGRDTETESK